MVAPLIPDVLRRLRDAQQGVLNPSLSGVPALPGPVSQALPGAGLATLPFRIGAAGALAGMQADQQAARALTGLLLLANARANSALGAFPNSPGAQLAQAAQQGAQGQPNPLAALWAANEAAAARHPVVTGALNMETDP